MGVDELTYAGNHGLEVLTPGDSEASLEPAVERGWPGRAPVRARARRRTRSARPACGSRTRGRSRRFTGVVPATRKPPRSGRARSPSGPSRAGLEPRWGRKVLEIRPTSGVDKGTAVRRLLADDRIERRCSPGTTGPTSTRSGRCARWSTRGAARRGLHRHRLRRGARRSSPSRLDAVVAGPDGVRRSADCAGAAHGRRAGAAAADAVRRPAAGHRAADRRVGDRAGRGHGGRGQAGRRLQRR